MSSEAGAPQLPIATMNEGPLHAALKAWCARDGGELEVPVDDKQIDVVKGDLLIEIQTGSVSRLRRKLETLVDEHPVRLVHPIPYEKWIVRVQGEEREVLGRRKSRLRGRVEDAFEELVSVARLMAHPRFSVEIVLTQEDEVRRQEPGRAWRRKGWVIVERRLLDVVDSRLLNGLDDLRSLLPAGLPTPFTTADIAKGLDVSRDLAQKMAYCLREAGAIERVGKVGSSIAYELPG